MTSNPPAPVAPRRVGVILGVIMASYFMILLDNSIVFTGLARIRADLDFTTPGLSWVQTAYALTFGGLLLLGARAGDILGRRRMFVLGIAIFSIASLVIGFAPNGGVMLAARAVQGVGSAIVAPSSLALLTANFAEGPARTKAVAMYGSVAGIGSSFGLVLDGALTDLASWRLGFLINVPIGAVLIVAALRNLRETPKASGRFDIAGAVTSTLGTSSLVFGITRTADYGWGDPVTVIAIAGGLVVVVAFVAIEWRAAQPILPLRVFANRVRAGAFNARLLFAGARFGYFFFISQYLQGSLGLTPLQTGLAFLPQTIVQFAVALQVPRLTRRFGNGTLLAVGLAITATGMLWLSRVGADSTYWPAIALPMVLLGLGQGFGFAPLTSAGITAIEPRDSGAASGLVNVAHQLGGALGVSILVAVAVPGGSPSVTSAGLTTETAAGLTAAALLLILALVAAVATGGSTSGRRALPLLLARSARRESPLNDHDRGGPEQAA